MPDYPNRTMIAALKEASAIVVESVRPTHSASGGAGAWQVVLVMPAYSVASLAFTA
jgi:hypothetical protein